MRRGSAPLVLLLNRIVDGAGQALSFFGFGVKPEEKASVEGG